MIGGIPIREPAPAPPVPAALVDGPLWRTLPGRLLAHAETRPDAVALRDKQLGVWAEVTWRRYRANVEVVGRQLWELGVRPGDGVAILSDNCPEWLYADLGAQGIGARSVGIYQTNPAPDVAYVLSHSGAKVLFCEDQEQVDKAVEIADQTPTVEHVIVFDPRGTRGYEDARLSSWADFLAAGERAVATEPDWFQRRVEALDPEACAMIVYTSGTTGDPKGAMLSSTNALAVPDQLMAVVGGDARDQTLSYLPLCHVAEKIFSLFLPLSSGAVVHFGETLETVRDDLREVSPTVFLGVPRIWEKMHANVSLRMADSSWLKRTLFGLFVSWGQTIARRRNTGELTLADRLVWALGDLLVYRPLQERLGLRRCSLAVSGAAPIAVEILDWFHGIGVRIVEGYGQTECAGVSHVVPLDRPRLGTVGRGVPGTEVKRGEGGEILVRGPGVFLGYLHNPDATAATVDADGWLHTGDVGEADDDGFWRITGRIREIIITAGGKNLSPEKIENALKVSPYIKEVVAIGDRRKFVSALVQLDRDAVGDWAQRQNIVYTSYVDLTTKPAVQELVSREIDRGNDNLARVEQVRAFRFLPRELNQDDGELTATQKVRRRAVQERYEALIESIYSGEQA